jgi:hypothetical protein
MARKEGSKNRNTLDFYQRFDKLCKTHGDPLILMFKIAGNKDSKISKDFDPSHRLEAAKQLLSYRYPRLKAIEVDNKSDDKQIEITWLESDAGSNSIQPEQVAKDVSRRH